MDITKRLAVYQEGVVALAIRECCPDLAESVHWSIPLGSSFIDPDVTIGVNPLAPETIVCIAHCESESESQRKFWRNIAEISLSKCRMRIPPLVVNVVFESFYKPELLRLMEHIFDAQLVLRDIGCDEIVRIGPKLISGKLRGMERAEETIATIRTHFQRSKVLREQFSRLKSKLGIILKSPKKKHAQYWLSCKRTLPNDTTLGLFEFTPGGSLRRGISKLLCFPEATRLDVLNLARNGALGEIDLFARGLGWVTRGLGNKDRVSDEDLKQLATAFNDNAIVNTIAMMPTKVLHGITRVAVERCRELGAESAAIADYFTKNVSVFTSSFKLASAILKCFRDPTMDGKVAAKSRWILNFCLAAGKALLDRPQGYGITKLGRDLNFDGSDRVRFWIPAYNAGKQAISPDIASRIAAIFSQQFTKLIAKLGEAEVVANLVLKWMTHTLVEVKLCAYPPFRPGEILFEQACLSSGFQVRRETLSAFDGFFPAPGAATTKGLVIRKGLYSCFVKVQSGAKNTHDKAKELAGRRFLMMASENAMIAPRFTNTMLVLDGPYKPDEAKMCLAAGWGQVVALDRINMKFLGELV